MEHPVLTRIIKEGFTPLGWFTADDMGETKFVILIGNAGPAMFNRFASEREMTMDAWTRKVVEPLAHDLGAKAVFPFDAPPLPFLTWARRGGAGHVSPLGLNIVAKSWISFSASGSHAHRCSQAWRAPGRKLQCSWSAPENTFCLESSRLALCRFPLR